MPIKISIATNLTQGYLEEVLSGKGVEGNNPQEIEIFGAFPGYESALDRFYKKDISRDEFHAHIRSILLAGMNFNYLLNSLTLEPEAIRPEVEEIFSLGIRTVTVSREDCIDFLCQNFPEIDVVVSITYATKDIQTIDKLSRFKNVKRIILDQSVNHNFPLLIELIKKAKSLGIEIELLANELCYSDCSLRKKHYTSDSCYQKDGVNYGNICGIMKDKSIIFKSPWIRPEDMVIYEKLGVDYIKIAGRNTPTSLLVNCLGAYLKRGYEGNFFDLMDLDGKREESGGKEDSRYLSNKKLDTYLVHLLKSQGTH